MKEMGLKVSFDSFKCNHSWKRKWQIIPNAAVEGNKKIRPNFSLLTHGTERKSTLAN